MKFSKSLIFLSSLAFTLNAYSYSVVDRYKIIDDKLQTDAMLRPFGHDFIFDLNVALNKDVQTFVKDIKDAANSGNTTTAQNILNKYENTEQTLKLNLNIGIPIFSFSAWDVKVQPNFRIMADVGANLGVRKDTLTPADIIKIANVAIPADILSNINAVWTATGTGNNLFSTSNCDTYYPSNPANTECKALTSANILKPDPNVPNLNLFLKAQGKFGLFNQYTYGEHFFGDFNFYGMVRTDAFQLVNYAMIAAGSKVDLPKKANNETSLQFDYKLGYKNDNYSVALGLEEIKIAKLKERDAESKEQVYGYDPLIRLHAQADYRFTNITLQPFFGLHKRSGYGLGDGIYAGATTGAHVWGDRLGLSLRGMMDKQYLTINPRFKLWVMQLDYSLKSPLKSTDGDVKLSAIHSIDLRLFF